MRSLICAVRDFIFGVTLPGRSLVLMIKHPTLLLFGIMPLALTLGLYFYLIRTTQAWAKFAMLGLFQKWGVAAHGFMASVLHGAAWLVLLIVGVITFSFVSSIVATPFNDLLAEKSERYAGPALLAVKHVSVTQRVRVIWIDLVKTIASLFLGLLALLISWVPLLSFVSFILFFLILAFQFVSYPQTRRGLGFFESLPFLWKNFFSCLGFGIIFSLLFAVPILSSFCLPLAVVSGTLLFSRGSKGMARV